MSAKEWTGFPDNAIAIAEDGSGDYLVILYQGENPIDNHVYHWYHETGEVSRATLA